MAVKFDNIDDVISKFVGTVCYYEGKPVRVEKALHSMVNEGSFTFILKPSDGGPLKSIEITDPKFNYRDFNLGYANLSSHAVWLFRRPLKQYQQGLRHNQVGMLCAVPAGQLPDDGFGFTKNYIKMLSDDYPPLSVCTKQVTVDGRHSSAFHRDFAISFNPLHGDYTIEFRGKNIGISHDLVDFKLTPAHEHLRETLQEVILGDKIKRTGTYGQ